MKSSYSILLIDKKADVILSLLKPFIDKFNLYIIEARSLKDVKESMNSYSTILDLVIMDIDFEDKDVTGLELLKDIKSKFINLPVLIVSDNYIKKGVESVVEAIKSGANGYIGRMGIKSDKLVINIFKEIENSNSYFSKSNRVINPFLTLCKTTDKKKKIYQTYFAYEFNSIIRPKDEYEENEFTKSALSWHHDLFSVLSLLESNYNIIFRFSFIPTSDKKSTKIKIYVIFNVSSAEESKNATIVKNIYDEINLYFQTNYLNSGPIYYFSIMKKEDVKSLLIDPVKKRMNLSTFTMNLNDKANDKIMNAIENYDEVEKKIAYTVTNDKYTLSTLQRTLEHIYSHKNEMIFDIVLNRRELNEYQSSNIRNLKSIFSVKYFEENIKNYLERLEKFSDEESRFFDVKYLLFHNNIPENLSYSVKKDFFSNITSVKTNEFKGKLLNLSYRDELLKMLEENGLYSVIHYSEMLKYFRIPLPSLKLHKGIENTFSSHYYKPHGISKTGPILGVKKTRYGEKVIRISDNDLKKHIYILGQTGTGKTSMLFTMLMERIYNNEGVALIDPHGDFFKEVVNKIPNERKKDLIVFDPTLNNSLHTINMLEYNKDFPEQKTFIIDEFIKIFDDLYDLRLTGGPIFEQYMRNAMLLVMDDADKKYTVKDIVRVFENTKFRDELIDNCKDPDVKDFWEEIALRAGGEASLSTIAPYVTSKLNRFIHNHFLKNIIDNKNNSVNFRDLMDKRKILLISLTKGKLGDVGVTFLGKILLNKIIMAAYTRENVSKKERVNFTLFIDEFQNFTSKDIESAMSEARKYNLSLVFANQTLGQVDPKILESMLGNVGSIVMFRLGVLDAERMRDFYEPKLSKTEMINLPNYLCVSRMQINDAPSEPFIFSTFTKDKFFKDKFISL